ncbi:MAG: ERAP1-like C-terminal domain-containing protein [Muribaculaceae bacterium]|nr:ERAP1-like C-terminal domain-containing protein [Muribaculaceae bacterium]
MKNWLQISTIFLLVLLTQVAVAAPAVTVEDGVSRELAQYRSVHISDVCYDLSFTVPSQKSEPVCFEETLMFDWTGGEDLQIDFQGDASQLSPQVIVNDTRVNTVLVNEHIVIPARYLVQGDNTVSISGYSGDKALNRSDEYLYTLFVPDHARSVFPCFDQPDLKARFILDLTVPDGWVSISNETTMHIPTYLFSFTAGRFQVKTAIHDGRLLTALYRETDPAKVAQLPIVFDQVALSLRWMEEYTGIPYPFEHYGFVVLPGYQFGGMEHPGCIQFNDQRIFLGPEPTPDEEMSRLNLIAHETAHMWFGDLVTMRWFDDVWTKEVYANFMADKIAREQFPDINHDLAFIKSHYPLAMSTDRTQGTHSIQQPLDNMNKAGLLYGNIIYHKAPIMMRKLEQDKGADALREGLRCYLTDYAYSNASWDDLIVELDRFNPEHSAQSFSDVWVKQKGMPVISSGVHMLDAVRVVQYDPCGRNLVWKQGFDIGYLDENGRFCQHPIYMNDYDYLLDLSYGKGLFVNSNAEGYGQFKLDREGISRMSQAWKTMADNDLTRYAAVLNLYENLHLGNITAKELAKVLLEFLDHEKNELIASTTCSFVGDVMACLDRKERAATEQRLFSMSQQHPLQSVRQTLLRQLSIKAVSPKVVNGMNEIWDEQSATFLNPRDYMRMAYHLAVMQPDRWQEILDVQRGRLNNEDQRREFDFISRACNPDTQVQQQLFNELLQAENRRVEPWARDMLALLNDPTREPFSNRYITPGLDALPEIQQTGDIFFPGYWLTGLLSGHKSDEAKALVRQWIDTHADLEPALMNKLKENAYWLLVSKIKP